MASNVDIVRTGYESFIRGDIQTTLAMFAEDIEWHEPEWTYGPASGSFCGRDEVLRRIFAPIPELNDAFALEPHEFYCDGDTVIVTGVFNVTPRGAQAPSGCRSRTSGPSTTAASTASARTTTCARSSRCTRVATTDVLAPPSRAGGAHGALARRLAPPALR